jgi:hypothetical protein
MFDFRPTVKLLFLLGGLAPLKHARRCSRPSCRIYFSLIMEVAFCGFATLEKGGQT